MAEFAVSLVVEKLTNLLSQQAAYLDGVSQKIVHLRNELRWMRSFLKDADMKKEENDLMQQWVSDIRDVAYETEEVIETYVSRAAAQGAFDFVTKPFYLYKVGREIESIRSRIREISGRRETYGVARNGRGGAEGSAANERLRWWRQPSPHVEEDDIIELVEDTKALLTQLTSMESRRRVVSIIGMGVQTKKLIHLWVAEGFLPQEGEETAEGVAEKCLNELIDRCMIQVGRLSSLGRVKTVRIHDLLRDLAISQGREEIFLEIHHGNKAEPSESMKFITETRQSHQNLSQQSPEGMQSILAMINVERKRMKIGFIEKKLNVIYKNFKLLRVLDMEGVRVVSLPDTVGSLIQLRYLGLRKTNLEEELPLSIGNLQNLQTLDLRYSCFLKRIPNVIWKMVQLRHLLLYTPFDSPDSGHLRMDTLSNLQSLPYIEAGNWIDNGGLANMTSLRQLGIDGLSREQVTSVISTLERLKDIQSLSLLLTEQEMFPTLTGLSCCEHLQKLCFYGKMEKLPDPQEFPPNLVKLKLYNSQLPRDSITKFGRLPNLEMLVLGDGSYNWREMVFVSESFPKLEILRFHLLKELEDWIIEESAMPKLKHLVINRCEKLKRIPDGLKLATTLKELEIVGMPVEFEYRLRTKDFSEFKHTPSWQSPTCRLARGTIRLTEHSSNMLARTFLPVRQVHVNFLEYHCHGFTVL
ncbi:hypothetical protein V6N11_076566 [Hibiscus sabdariffa]|uniref:Rx N-terminal domain-containing protein n=1 Tax=Hibiscus sabdariffa TaxID=183260 RepID=A0ABR2Q6N7_9ROSI